MNSPSNSEITQLLVAWNHGDQAPLEALSPLIDQELHWLIKRYLAGERRGCTRQPTALVNAAWGKRGVAETRALGRATKSRPKRSTS